MIAIGLVALYAVLGFFAAPPIVRAQLEKRLSAELGRNVRVEKVRLNPFTLSAALEGFAIREADGAKNFVGWKRAFANFDSWSFFTGEWRFDELALDTAEARVALDGSGQPNFADLLAKFSAKPAAPGPPATANKATPRPLHVRKLTVTSAKLDYADDSAAKPFATTVGPVTFSLRDFHTGGKNDAPGEFAATTESGETVSWRGSVALAPLRSDGEFSLGNIVLKKYMPYLARFAEAEITDGVLAMRAEYHVSIVDDHLALRVADGAVKLAAFKLGAPGASEPAVALNTLELTGLAANTAARTATIGRVALSGGRIAVTRDAQGFDLQRLLTPKPGAPPSSSASPSSTASAPPALPAFDATLGELAVSGLTVVFTDTTTPRPAVQELTQLALNVKNVALARLVEASPVEFSAQLAGGGGVKLAGQLAPQPLKGELALELTAAPLASVSPYVENFVALRIAQGAVTTTARFTVDTPALGAVPAIFGRAEASIDNFSALEADGSDELTRWTTLALRGVEFVSAPAPKLLMAEVEWTDLAGRAIIAEDRTLNLAGLMRPPPPAPENAQTVTPPAKTAPAPSPGEPAAFVAIDRFILNNAALTFLDRSMEPDVKLTLAELSGAIAGLSSANLARADVDLRGKVDRVAPVSIKGQINPLTSEAFTDLKVEFRGIELTPTSPYLGKYAGYTLERGMLSLEVRAKLEQRKLDTSNVLTLDQFTLGQKTDSPDATKLPVTLALALLRDRAGKIVIDVPVQGSLDDPNFRIGRVVLRVIGNLLVKAATSPFALLGSMFGGGKGEELAFQEFVPGTTEFTEESLKKIEVVAKALRERPGLRLEIAGGANAAMDGVALREQALEKGLRVMAWEELRKGAQPGAVVPPPEQITIAPEQSARLIATMYRAAFPSAPEAAGEDAEAPAAKVDEKAAGKSSASSRRSAPASIGRNFRRGGAPSATIAANPAPRVELPPPRPYSSATAGVASASSQPIPAAIGPTLDEMRARLLAAMPLDENAYRELAAERARRVREQLISEGQIEPERVTLIAETTKGARADLQLK